MSLQQLQINFIIKMGIFFYTFGAIATENGIWGQKVRKVIAKKVPKITVTIRRGPVVSPGQMHFWKKFWQKLISETGQEKP
jgi:hypothetical protein